MTLLTFSCLNIIIHDNDKNTHTLFSLLISPVYTGPQTGSGLESRLRPCNGGGPGNPDHDLDRLRLHRAESGIGSRKVVSCKRGYSVCN